MWITPAVLFLRMARFLPSLLVTVPSCPESSSAHHSLPPATINVTSICWCHKTYAWIINHVRRWSCSDITRATSSRLPSLEGNLVYQCKQVLKNLPHNWLHYHLWTIMAHLSSHCHPPRLARLRQKRALNNWNVLQVTLRLKCSRPPFLLFPLVLNDACILPGYFHI